MEVDRNVYSLFPIPCSLYLPRSLDPKRLQFACLILFKVVLHYAVDTAPTRTFFQTGAQLGDIFHRARSHHLYISILGVAHPTAQVQFTGLSMHEPPKAHTLHPSSN